MDLSSDSIKIIITRYEILILAVNCFGSTPKGEYNLTSTH